MLPRFDIDRIVWQHIQKAATNEEFNNLKAELCKDPLSAMAIYVNDMLLPDLERRL